MLLSIRKNTKDILIPGEEHIIRMYPMGYEEFLWATGDDVTSVTIWSLIESGREAGNSLHRSLMRSFRLYMLVGRMPQAVDEYVEKNNLESVDPVKRKIIELYEDDFMKVDGKGLAADMYDAIPSNLSKNASRYVLSTAKAGTREEEASLHLPDMISSFAVNIAWHANNPSVGFFLEKDSGRYKLFTSDTGLFITLASGIRNIPVMRFITSFFPKKAE